MASGLDSVATAAVISGPLEANASSIADIIKLAPDISLTCGNAVYSDCYNLSATPHCGQVGTHHYWQLLIDVSSAHARPSGRSTTPHCGQLRHHQLLGPTNEKGPAPLTDRARVCGCATVPMGWLARTLTCNSALRTTPAPPTIGVHQRKRPAPVAGRAGGSSIGYCNFA